MKLTLLSILGLATLTMAQYDAPCGSYKTCLANCPNQDFFPQIDQCELGEDGQPDCYVNFYCA
ncbi:hypothetical protein BDV18DRAFT_130593 [Aspergillus unguis]